MFVISFANRDLSALYSIVSDLKLKRCYTMKVQLKQKMYSLRGGTCGALVSSVGIYLPGFFFFLHLARRVARSIPATEVVCPVSMG